MIYGVALLAACFLVGKVAGELLGQWMGINANVGGVGFSMILLIISMQWLHRLRGRDEQLEGGIIFWSNLYIPVIVAMSACQNVKGAISSGLIALMAGMIPVVVCFAMVPIVSRMNRQSS